MLPKITSKPIVRFLNSTAAWFLEWLSQFIEKWLESVREHSSPLYHDYIEGMLSEYAEVRETLRCNKNYSEIRIILVSIPWGIDIVWGICRLTLSRYRRALSLCFYGTEQVLSLMHSLKPLPKNTLRLREFFSLLHWLTGNVGTQLDKIELKLSPTAQVTAWGENAEATFGFTEDDILGKEAVGTFIPGIETGGRTLTELIREICSTPEAYTFNVNENQSFDGSRCWTFWLNVPTHSETGELIEVSCVGVRTEDPKLLQLLIKLLITLIKRVYC
jgi:hypothetical protein